MKKQKFKMGQHVTVLSADYINNEAQIPRAHRAMDHRFRRTAAARMAGQSGQIVSFDRGMDGNLITEVCQVKIGQDTIWLDESWLRSTYGDSEKVVETSTVSIVLPPLGQRAEPMHKFAPYDYVVINVPDPIPIGWSHLEEEFGALKARRELASGKFQLLSYFKCPDGIRWSIRDGSGQETESSRVLTNFVIHESWLTKTQAPIAKATSAPKFRIGDTVKINAKRLFSFGKEFTVTSVVQRAYSTALYPPRLVDGISGSTTYHGFSESELDLLSACVPAVGDIVQVKTNGTTFEVGGVETRVSFSSHSNSDLVQVKGKNEYWSFSNIECVIPAARPVVSDPTPVKEVEKPVAPPVSNPLVSAETFCKKVNATATSTPAPRPRGSWPSKAKTREELEAASELVTNTSKLLEYYIAKRKNPVAMIRSVRWGRIAAIVIPVGMAIAAAIFKALH